MTLKEEIQNIIYMKIGNDKVGITWNETKDITNEILRLFEKQINSIPYAQGMEYHCCASVQYTKDKMKEMLK